MRSWRSVLLALALVGCASGLDTEHTSSTVQPVECDVSTFGPSFGVDLPDDRAEQAVAADAETLIYGPVTGMRSAGDELVLTVVSPDPVELTLLRSANFQTLYVLERGDNADDLSVIEPIPQYIAAYAVRTDEDRYRAIPAGTWVACQESAGAVKLVANDGTERVETEKLSDVVSRVPEPLAGSFSN